MRQCFAAKTGARDVPDGNVEEDDGNDDGALDIVADAEGQPGDGDEDQCECVGDLVQEELPEGSSGGGLKGVGAVAGEADGGLLMAQAMAGVGAEAVRDVVGGQRMGAAWLLYGRV